MQQEGAGREYERKEGRECESREIEGETTRKSRRMKGGEGERRAWRKRGKYGREHERKGENRGGSKQIEGENRR